MRHLILGTLGFALVGATAVAESARGGDASFARQHAYQVFGDNFYHRSMGYPTPAPPIVSAPLANHAIRLKASVRPNAGADSSNWTEISPKTGFVYYRAEYGFADLDGFDADAALRDLQANSANRSSAVVWNLDGMRAFYARAKMHAVVFPTKQFKFKYYPGRYLILHPSGARYYPGTRNYSAQGAPRGGAWSADMERVAPAETSILAGVFKGTFDNIDVLRGGRAPGLVVNGRTIDAPSPDLATAAVFADGSLRVGRYQALGNAAQAIWLRQNGFPLVENGRVSADGAYPRDWAENVNNIVRSYLFTSSDGEYVGYVWTIYAPSNYVASTLQNLGFGEAMLLDIHPAINAAFASPGAMDSPRYDFFAFGRAGSYPLVPQPSGFASVLAGIGETFEGPAIQWPITWAKSGSAGSNDFFGVFLKE